MPAARTGILGFVLRLCEGDASITRRAQVTGTGACRHLILDHQRQLTAVNPLCDLLPQYPLRWL
jgi:hypothetical protein